MLSTLPVVRLAAMATFAALTSTASLLLAAPPAARPALPQLPGEAPVDRGDRSAGKARRIRAESKPQSPDPIRLGIVQIERGGRTIAIGTVLSNDGRVLTSISGLRKSEQVDIRYANGTVVKAKVSHKDAAWDLALLVPQTGQTGQPGRWTTGLEASATGPQDLEALSFTPNRGNFAPIPVALKGLIDVQSRDGEPLRSVLELDWQGAISVPGAPLIDPDGKVIGIAIHACEHESSADVEAPQAPQDGPATSIAWSQQPGQVDVPCAPVTVGAPVYALRGFLRKAIDTTPKSAAWLGVGGTSTESGSVRGVRVASIAAGSPAETAGLSASGEQTDTIVAVDGTPVDSPKQLAEIIAKCSVGQHVKLLVFTGGKFRDVNVTLRAAP
ncbi:MAG: PDZ domain-containing protein [Polyangiaceae bacterium]|nr:PDZ domain-containing protein [Polyangiaceae bacterium]